MKRLLHRLADLLFEPPAVLASWLWYRVLNGVRLK